MAGKVPTAPTIASMIGGLQVQEALKLIHGLPVDAGAGPGLERPGQQLLQDGLPAEGRLPEPRHLSASRSSCRSRRPHATADELFAAAASHFGGKQRS